MLLRKNRYTVCVVHLLSEPVLPLRAVRHRSANHIPECGEQHYFGVKTVPSRCVLVVDAYRSRHAHVSTARDSLSVCLPPDKSPVIQKTELSSASSPSCIMLSLSGVQNPDFKCGHSTRCSCDSVAPHPVAAHVVWSQPPWCATH
eukprot:1217640-Prymnesium_polylepis.1